MVRLGWPILLFVAGQQYCYHDVPEIQGINYLGVDDETSDLVSQLRWRNIHARKWARKEPRQKKKMHALPLIHYSKALYYCGNCEFVQRNCTGISHVTDNLLWELNKKVYLTNRSQLIQGKRKNKVARCFIFTLSMEYSYGQVFFFLRVKCEKMKLLAYWEAMCNIFVFIEIRG